MYAIIATGGKQYRVAEGDVIKVEKLGLGAGDILQKVRKPAAVILFHTRG